jgi:integrase
LPQSAHRKNLTATLIKGLKPAPKGSRYQISDTQMPGLAVRVTDAGRRTYVLYVRYPGSPSPSRREIGNCTDISLTAARDKGRHWRALIGQGIDPADAEAAQRAAQARERAITFESVAADFIKEKLPGERKGRDVEREIRRDLMPRWKGRPITSITDLDVLGVIKAKIPDGKVGSRNLLALIKRFFTWAAAQRVYGVTVSPCAHLRASAIIGETNGPRDRILSDDEIFAYWRAASQLPYPYGAIYKVLMLTALRLSEVVDASLPEFDFRNKLWVIPAERMKGKDAGKKQARAHAVPLTADMLAVLDALPRFKGGKFLFSTNNGTSSVWMGTKPKERLDRRMLLTLRALARKRGGDVGAVELPHFVQHDVRRTVRSQLSRLKIAEEVREAILAHARPGIKKVYDIHDYLDEKREAFVWWSARLRDIVAPPPHDARNVVRLPTRT